MRRPTRRALLAATGAVAIAGCLGDLSDSTSDDDPADDDDGQASNGDPSLPPGGDSPDGCPEYDVDRVVAAHEIDPDETAIHLVPSAETIAGNERITFTLHNETDSEFLHNPYRWHLHKWVDDRWHYVAPLGWNEPLSTLQPGGTHDWDLRVDNAGVEDGASVREASTGRDPIAGLGGGTYAFGTRGWFDDGPYDGTIGFCARFELDADDLAPTPTNAITSTEWEDDTLVATSDRGDPESEYTRPGAYELVRTDDDVAGTPLVTETLLRNDQLRDVVALARDHDADRVRLEEFNGTSPIFGSREDGHYEYDGNTYEVSTRELEDE
ncbi:hypothetical protein ACFO5R_10785 [Halosolutus amylolyticus]|uniref:Uncharacterized protein n=1 Tax=Halosolutus amylolyticus TaxID=2932267 RepID=A0ABD5PPL1_9EURY|nr:hypothetical protein [Halosolutus amylolyticus]